MTKQMSALVLVLAVVLGACASSSGGGADVAAGSDAASDAAAVESPTDDSSDNEPVASDDTGSSDTGSGGVANGESSMAASSPIGAFFADGGGFDAAVAEFAIRVEEEIVLCMAAQGFEFVRTSNQVNEIDQLQNELTIREWTAQFGYGISTSFDSIAQNQATDPNADILFSLTAGEREIWIETLTGGNGFGGDFNSVPLEEQGCIGASLIATGGQEAIEGIDTFGTAYEEGEAAIFDEREMVDAIAAWSQCMSQEGYPGFSAQDDPEEQIGERFDQVTAPLSAALDNLSDEEGQALVSGESLDLADLPDLDLDALRDLQAEEIALALVDLDCYELEVQATYEPLRDVFERGLLTEYSTEFDALKNIGN